jgi:hypothetical protein
MLSQDDDEGGYLPEDAGSWTEGEFLAWLSVNGLGGSMAYGLKLEWEHLTGRMLSGEGFARMAHL